MGNEMMNNQIKEFSAVIQFRIAASKSFTVVVKAWLAMDKWQYNVYANIFENHPLFNDVEKAKSLPFNCGCTYDSFKANSPTSNDYEWQKETKALVVGSDYSHIHDNYDNHSSPFDSIPHEVLRDAKELVEALRANI
jgi:hypothetical protein